MTVTNKQRDEWCWHISDSICKPLITEFQLEQRQGENKIDVIYRVLPVLVLTVRGMQIPAAALMVGIVGKFHVRHYHTCFQFCDIADMLAEP